MIINQKLCSFDKNTGSLFLDFRECLGDQDSFFKLNSWKSGCKTLRYEKHKWVDYPLDLQIIPNELNKLENNHPIAQFVSNIPTSYVNVLSNFSAYQTSLLNILSRYPHSADILTDFPLLLWLSVPELITLHEQKAIEILRGSYTELLRLVLGYGSKSLLKTLRKINEFQYEQADHSLLCQVLTNNKIVDMFRHKDQIVWTRLKLYIREQKLLKYKSIQNWICGYFECNNSDTRSFKKLIHKAAISGRAMNIAGYERIIMQSQTIQHVERLLERWRNRDNNDKSKFLIEKYGDMLQEPPYPGNINIIPIQTISLLTDEGRRMEIVSADSTTIF